MTGSGIRQLLLLQCSLPVLWPLAAAIAPVSTSLAAAQSTTGEGIYAGPVDTPNALDEAGQKAVADSVDRALEWLANRQERRGSFPGLKTGQPGITSLCVMAFMSCGHLPGEGRYGHQLQRAIDYVMDQQRSDRLICELEPERVWRYHYTSHTGTYSHAISGAMLSEAYGMGVGADTERIARVIRQALDYTLDTQYRQPPGRPQDAGGWRYVVPNHGDVFVTDLSITAWQVFFLRSAKNAGFVVPKQQIDEALAYVRRVYRPGQRIFTYDQTRWSRGMVGAGIAALALGGDHDGEQARGAAQWLLEHPFSRYQQTWGDSDRFHYSVYYGSFAMFQMGGQYWQQFYPVMVRTMLSNQMSDGSWQPDNNDPFGNAYTTAFVVLALTQPYQLLPVQQR